MCEVFTHASQRNTDNCKFYLLYICDFSCIYNNVMYDDNDKICQCDYNHQAFNHITPPYCIVRDFCCMDLLTLVNSLMYEF